jgi:hypothetical protein
MTEFDAFEFENCDKLFKNKYGLFKIKVERGNDSYHSDDKSKRIFLYKWQNSWEVVFETRVSKSFSPTTQFTSIEYTLQNMADDRIKEIVNMSEEMFAQYSSIGSFFNKLKQELINRKCFKGQLSHRIYSYLTSIGSLTHK